VSEHRLSIREATEIVSNRLNVSTDEAQIRLIEAIAKGKIRGIINPKYEQQLADALAPTITNVDDPLAALRESTTRGAMVHSLLIQYGMVSQDELLIWLDSFGERKLNNAPEALIHEIVSAVYHDPASGGPSYRDLPQYVLPRLKKLGFTASGRAIQEIGKADEFKPFRRKAGRTRSSKAG
jgi:hypothetical protein